MSSPPTHDGVADLRQLVTLGERLAAASDETALATTCCAVVCRLFGAPAAAFVTDRVFACEGVSWAADVLTGVRHAVLDAFLPGDGFRVVPAASLPGPAAASLAALGAVELFAAPIRVQHDLVGCLVAPPAGDPARARSMLQSAAHQASAFLAALRLIEAVRAQTREVEALLEKRTRELRAAETHLIVRDRLAAIGTLAAGIGHEIANPLASVMLNNSALSMRLARSNLPAPALAEAQRLLAENDEALERIRAIVSELRTFARRDDEAHTVFDVRAVIEQAIRLARAQLRGIDVQLSFAPSPPIVGSAGRIGQVFLNLLVNAAQAVAGVPNPRIEIRGEPCGAEVVVTVADNGVGIAPEHLPRIFDLYFTTKPQGEGTGLGLAIAHDIVTRHGGRIEVESQPGRGATFRIRLPSRAASQATMEPPSSVAPTPARPEVRPALRRRSNPDLPSGRPRLLIVDDEVAILRALGRELQAEFDVATARSGDEAEDILRTGPVDILLCDINLLGESGLEVASRLVARDARLSDRIVYMTGGTLSEGARVAAEQHPERFVAKPFDVPELVRLLKHVAKAS